MFLYLSLDSSLGKLDKQAIHLPGSGVHWSGTVICDASVGIERKTNTFVLAKICYADDRNQCYFTGDRLATRRRKRPFQGHLVGIMECAGMTLAVQIPEQGRGEMWLIARRQLRREEVSERGGHHYSRLNACAASVCPPRITNLEVHMLQAIIVHSFCAYKQTDAF